MGGGLRKPLFSPVRERGSAVRERVSTIHKPIKFHTQGPSVRAQLIPVRARLRSCMGAQWCSIRSCTATTRSRTAATHQHTGADTVCAPTATTRSRTANYQVTNSYTQTNTHV